MNARGKPTRTLPWRVGILMLLLITLAPSAMACSRQDRHAAEDGFDLIQDVARMLEQGAEGGSLLASRKASTVTVSRVIDGDTVEITPRIAGVEDVRLIGVDTPESTTSRQPLGEAAKAFTTRRLEGEKVRLVLGEEKFDPYHRLLGNITVPGNGMYQRELLSRGLAQTLFYEPNTAYEAEFSAIQENARGQSRGIWGLRHFRQCQLTDRGNGLGEGSAGC